jgi:HSP20 family protein
MKVPEYAPLVHISEDDEGYVIKAELPGVKQEDATVTIDNATLIITGDRKFEQNRKRDRPVEHANGRFAHVFLLPPDAWPAEVSAEFRNEILIMHLAKNDEGGPKQVVAEAVADERIPVRESHSPRWGINE